MKYKAAAAAAALSMLVGPTAQAAPPEKEKPPSGAKQQSAPSKPAGNQSNAAADIVTQPVRDVGVGRAKIPPPLAKAVADPYSLQGLKNCRQFATALKELNEVLGPDFGRGGKYEENRMAKLAEAGGRTVINSIIPFRGLVREVSGAAPADRRLRAAINAGLARRGFLRGVYTTRKCRPTL